MWLLSLRRQFAYDSHVMYFSQMFQIYNSMQVCVLGTMNEIGEALNEKAHLREGRV